MYGKKRPSNEPNSIKSRFFFAVSVLAPLFFYWAAIAIIKLLGQTFIVPLVGFIGPLPVIAVACWYETRIEGFNVSLAFNLEIAWELAVLAGFTFGTAWLVLLVHLNFAMIFVTVVPYSLLYCLTPVGDKILSLKDKKYYFSAISAVSLAIMVVSIGIVRAINIKFALNPSAFEYLLSSILGAIVINFMFLTKDDGDLGSPGVSIGIGLAAYIVCLTALSLLLGGFELLNHLFQ